MIPYRERWHREESGLVTRAPRMMGMGMGIGFGGAAAWTPAAFSPSLWMGSYEEARATKAASPAIPGAGWAGATWAGSGLGPYTHTAGATADLTQAVLTAGNRYSTSHTVSGLTAGTVTHKQGTAAGTARAANGTYTDELTAQAAAAIWAPSSDFDGAVLVNAIANLSLSSYLPRIGAALTQAVPTAMPWASSTLINGRMSMQFANGDSVVSADASSAWKFMHDGSAFTHISVVRANAFPSQCILGQTVASLSLSSVGYGLHYNNAASAIDLYIANGGGAAWAINDRFSAAPGAGTAWICTMRNDGVGNTVCWKNSVNMARTRYSGAPSHSAANPNTAFTIGVGADANMLDQAVYNRCLTDAEVTQIGQYMAAQWGIAW